MSLNVCLKITFGISIFSCVGLMPLQAQENDSQGHWIYNRAKSHQSAPPPFPSNAIDLEKKLTFSKDEKRKMGIILEALKEIQPKPKYHSYLFGVTALYPSPRMDNARIAARDYRFGYALELTQIPFWVENGKTIQKDIDWSGSMESTIRTPWGLQFLTVNVNYIPKFLGGSPALNYSGPTLDLEREFTYKSVGGKETSAPKDLELGHIVSITARDDSFADAARFLGPREGLPSTKFGNEADQEIAWRKFSSESLIYNGPFRLVGKVAEPKLRHQFHEVQNMVILSHNNRLPLVPLSVDHYLTICEKITRERIEQFANDPKSMAMEEANLRFIAQLRESQKNRLNQHAIVSLAYANAWSYRSYTSFEKQILNQKTGQQDAISANLLQQFFVTDPRAGKAYYSYDKGYYKDMADGEIRTIAVTWNSKSRSPDHPEFGRGYSLGQNAVDTNQFADNPDSYVHQFNQKFDWSKLKSVLGK